MSLEFGKTYRILNSQSSLALHLSEDDNRSIIGEFTAETRRQLWIPLFLPNGRVIIRSAENDKPIGFEGHLNDGVELVVGNRHSIPQAWDIREYDEESEPPVFRISLIHALFVMGLPIVDSPPGTHVRLFGPTGDPNQLWIFIKGGSYDRELLRLGSTLTPYVE